MPQPAALIFAARAAAFAFGAWLAGAVVLSAIRTFILPRRENTLLTRFVFMVVGFFIKLRLKWAKSYQQRDRILAFTSPLALFILPLLWLSLVSLGYTAIFWSISESLDLRAAFVLSGSSLLTLGFRFHDELPVIILAFSEAALGMMLVALLIGYLPTLYATFSAREAAVTKLEVRAGVPPSPVEMIRRLQFVEALQSPEKMHAIWSDWEDWFTMVGETHTTLAPLIFFRSPRPGMHWLTAAGVVLDAAALISSTVAVPVRLQAGLTIRAGFIALRNIADFFSIRYASDPQPGAPISITREEFNAAYDELIEKDIAVRPDQQACWEAFAGWRVNYDEVLVQLAAFLQAPYAAWITDRKLPGRASIQVD